MIGKLLSNAFQGARLNLIGSCTVVIALSQGCVRIDLIVPVDFEIFVT